MTTRHEMEAFHLERRKADALEDIAEKLAVLVRVQTVWRNEWAKTMNEELSEIRSNVE